MIALTAELKEQLYRLEESLWRAETRYDRPAMDKCFAPDFFEFGRSGRTYTRDELLPAAYETGEIPISLPLPNFNITAIDENSVLITYLSELTRNGSLERANRASIWTNIGDQWQLRFHQGTPCP
ncbi:hypothetical protein MXMO3_00095 [Maritalea myrionectae]|uniref:DUF4440 domain-containing protein n=1 Tax=Maritalea myrionectae TaxID=454601 RepID=A0A2R4M9J2_9HYPH|nr:nuclear transport factor 2 family protein [Maritalea myrionectae]AVX02643.1 hypothetical protein MXMO3_00095 [Maritalea myrionectae]